MINQYFKMKRDTLMPGLEEAWNRKENKENCTAYRNNKNN